MDVLNLLLALADDVFEEEVAVDRLGTVGGIVQQLMGSLKLPSPALPLRCRFVCTSLLPLGLLLL